MVPECQYRRAVAHKAGARRPLGAESQARPVPALGDGGRYETGQPQAAQRLYAEGPVWTSAEHVRLMSGVKDALGLCGALGGLLTCPRP